MPAFVDKILRAGEGRILRDLSKVVALVNAQEARFVAMSDSDLRSQTGIFQERFAKGESEFAVDAEHIVLVNLSPLKQKISELRADELNLDINLTASNGEKKYVQVHRNLFEKSNYQTTNEGGLKAEPTYDYIELVKYISWVVRKPNTNYNERILQANLLGQYGSIEVTTPSPTQPSINVTTTPPSTQYPPIGRKGVEDEEEVLFNGELYWWIESLQQWRLQER